MFRPFLNYAIIRSNIITKEEHTKHTLLCKSKIKGIPQQVEVAQEVPGRLRPRIFLTFGTTRVVGR
jgi:hypothetical protein